MKKRAVIIFLLFFILFSPLFPYNFLGKIKDTSNKPLKDGYVLLKKAGSKNYIKSPLNEKGELILEILKREFMNLS